MGKNSIDFSPIIVYNSRVIDKNIEEFIINYKEVILMSKKYVYLFSEGNANMRELLGGKGANLAEMTNLGLPVPQGFTITTEACTQYYDDGRKINEDIQKEIFEYIAKLEEITGKKFNLQHGV